MQKPRKILLVGWDAADWQHITPLLDAGKLPVLESLVNRGVMGNLATLQPMLSPMLWNSVATGKQPWKHGVHGFMEPDPVHGGQRVWSSYSRNSKALWNILSQSGKTSNVINWWASHPAEPIRGCVVSNMMTGIRQNPNGSWNVPSGSTFPESLGKEIAPLAVFDREMTHQQILPFVPRAATIDQDNDQRLSVVARNLADMMTTHNIATHVMEHTDWDFMAVYYTAIDHFCHSFVSYHPPKLPWVSEKDFELYREVINSTYRFSDMTLGRLLQLAGPDTTVIVCSDHGFESGRGRLRTTPNEPAGPAYWHRKYGIFLAAGPGIKTDQRLYGATLVDVAPTVLQLFGLPVGEDMDGRVLTEMFQEQQSIETIPSWDACQSDFAGVHEEQPPSSPREAEELVRQFVALGYIDNVGDNREDQFRSASTEAKFNLARNLAWCRKYEQACPIFEELFCQDPWETRFILHFAKCLLSAGRYSEARRLMEISHDIEGTREDTAVCIWCEALGRLGERDRAIERIIKVERNANRPGVLLQVGAIYNQLRDFEAAGRVFSRVLEINPENAEAHMVMSGLMLRKRKNQQAADHALEAIGLIFHLARAHLNLGVALVRSGDPGDLDRAKVAFETALKIQPRFAKAHRWLAFLHAKRGSGQAEVSFHRSKAAQLWRRSFPPPQKPADPSFKSWPMVPDEKRRRELLYQKRPVRPNPARLSGKSFLLVSGLPRSGTSLMMQMLCAGGIEAQTDGQRSADKDNPRGYYEWEAIRKVASRPEILDGEGVDRKAIKAVSALLPGLPWQHQYQVIFMNRQIDEVVDSQLKMIERLGTDGASLSRDELRLKLTAHRDTTLRWLQGHPRAEVLVVEHRQLIEDPQSIVARLRDFVGDDRLRTWQDMASQVDPELYRNRSANG